MTDNVIAFPADTVQQIEPDEVLDGAKGALDEVVVIGRRKSGELFFASSTGYLPDMMWLVERARWFINQEADG